MRDASHVKETKIIEKVGCTIPIFTSNEKAQLKLTCR